VYASEVNLPSTVTALTVVLVIVVNKSRVPAVGCEATVLLLLSDDWDVDCVNFTQYKCLDIAKYGNVCTKVNMYTRKLDAP
jgi:hypothetical protein